MKRGSELDKVYEEFRDKALEPNTLFLLNTYDALKFLDAGKALGLVLLGVEGFSISDAGAYQPRQDFSNDAADMNASPIEFETATKQLIEKGTAAGIRFQVVFDKSR